MSIHSEIARPTRAWLSISPLAIILIAIILIAAGAAPACAQSGGIQWSEPVNLSESGTNSTHPTILADPYGYVHVFWSEDLNGEPVEPGEMPTQATATIMYRRWDGIGWSDPVDILAASGNDMTDFIAAAIGPDGRIHVVWTGLTHTYYSSALVSEAGNPHAWSEPAAIAAENARSSREESVAATPDGVVHVIYATRGVSAGVHHIASSDGGRSWSMPVRVSASLDLLERGYANVRVVSDGEGRLHATWQTFEEQGYGQGAYYCRSLDGGMTWSTPLLAGYRDPGDFSVEFPYVTVGKGADLHLIYVDGATSRGRAYRISHDSGETWSEPKTILESLEGISGYVMAVRDGTDQIHLIANMRDAESMVHGFYYARSEGDGFSMPVPIAVSAPSAPDAYYAAVAVRLGNEIHVVWHGLVSGEIWSMRGEIRGLPAATPLTAPTPGPEAPRAVQPTAVATAASADPTPTRMAFSPAGGTRPVDSAVPSLLIGILPAVLLVLGTVLWTRLRQRR